MISAVVATYNGEKYIKEQLSSILNQTMCVDEIVISDDGSTDSTLKICENYARENKNVLFDISLNTGRHGFYYNFYNALKKANGEFILLCDQDDIWEPQKVEIMYRCMKKNPDMLSLATSFSRFNENIGTINIHQKHPYSKKNQLRKIRHSEYLNFYNYLGMTMMIRKCLVQKFINVSDSIATNIVSEKIVSHDIIINYLATLNDGFYYLDQALTRRRSYPQSTSAVNGEKEFERSKYTRFYAYKYSQKVFYMNYFIRILELLGDKRILEVSVKQEFYQKRADYLEKRHFIMWISEIKDIGLYAGLSDYLMDLGRLIKDPQ